jgi:acetyl esterase/lipase
MMSTWYFVFGVLSFLATFVALVRVRHPAFLSFAVMMTGWLTGEYPVFHLVWQLLATAVMVTFGALRHPLGVAGLVLCGLSWCGLLVVRRVSLGAGESAEDALREGLGPDYLDRLLPRQREQLRTALEPGLTRHPLRFDATGIEIIHNISYGDHRKRNLLDVYRPATVTEPVPVLLQIHGGAWVIGHKLQQAQPLLHRMAQAGYVGVSINYRLGPKSRFPDQIVDVKRAIAWVRQNISQYGGDPNRIVLTGGSAGGHLSSLAALTPNLAEFQPGFEDVDTTVAGCVPFYGPPDFRDRDHIRGKFASLEPFLRWLVMPGSPKKMEALWDAVSPITHVRSDAPPFFIIQGTHDVLVWREEARWFVAALRAVSNQPVVYWEVPGAQHAFDTFNSWRSAAAVDAVERFVGWVTAPVPAAPASAPMKGE